MIFPYFFSVFINIHEYANYANMITCIFDHGIKGLFLNFNLVKSVVIYGLKAAEILLILGCPLLVNPVFNVIINIYEFAN